jgi:hypothetical protein
MREIRTSGSEGGGAPKGVLPTSIAQHSWSDGRSWVQRRRREGAAGPADEGVGTPRDLSEVVLQLSGGVDWAERRRLRRLSRARYRARRFCVDGDETSPGQPPGRRRSAFSAPGPDL